ncbi:fumarylacetoacetate hydrolase family protein [Spiractinospora alimapuensis]|uniref:fumarylacetoacetate hydrolase family protein n=1 Tax=Spiractinospora alimapuensis TaxID=2820884 RepID=UPI001F1A82F6|nr:fumarylacetoacetate hydrolase family protein [Spiractinospora alimapuensis]QVQ50819.1 fumarylacetoacetate hydrolase family protein [Spiractinospora alimapuensis]
MRFQRLGEVGHEIPAVIDDEGVVRDLRPITDDLDAEFLANDPVGTVRTALAADRLTPLAGAGDLRVGPPVPRPGAVVCVGMNYAAHAAESGAEPPTHPTIFFKHPNTVVGPNDDVLIPPGAQRVDWEVELAVVIGRRARYLESAARAPEHIAGYTIANDVSERAYQLEVSGGQWSKGKCCETFCPTGPALVPASELPDGPQALGLRSWVNGDPRQGSTTSDMVFGVHEIIYQLSQYMTLDPGDLLLTGTPAGVALSGRYPYLAPDDVVELEIDHLGRQRQTLRQAVR